MTPLPSTIERLTDPKYAVFALSHLPRRLAVRTHLRRLARYHEGVFFDFRPIRDALLAQILRYASVRCPYYRRVLGAAGFSAKDPLAAFLQAPLLDKAIIRDNAGTIRSERLARMVYSSVTTGGSTGEPLEFPASPNFDPEHRRFLYDRMGYRPGDRILAMDGTAVDPALVTRDVFWKEKSARDLPYGRMALSSLYLTDARLPKYVALIESFRPSIIRGYPAFIHQVAVHLMEGKTSLPFRLKGVELTSESASPSQIETIARAFGAPVFLQYGHSEAALFAYTHDETYEYFCSPVYGYVEVLDESGRHVSAGELGEVVVTGFYNYAMPFIRYRTGDLAIFGGDRDGIVRLESVVGRTQDYVVGSDGKKTLLTALVFGLHYKAFANIRRWQIVQDTPGVVTIKVVRDASFTARDEDEVRTHFRDIGRIETRFEFVESVPLTPRGKSKFLVQSLET